MAVKELPDAAGLKSNRGSRYRFALSGFIDGKRSYSRTLAQIQLGYSQPYGLKCPRRNRVTKPETETNYIWS